jgi:hypothetical protein
MIQAGFLAFPILPPSHPHLQWTVAWIGNILIIDNQLRDSQWQVRLGITPIFPGS